MNLFRFITRAIVVGRSLKICDFPLSICLNYFENILHNNHAIIIERGNVELNSNAHVSVYVSFALRILCVYAFFIVGYIILFVNKQHLFLRYYPRSLYHSLTQSSFTYTYQETSLCLSQLRHPTSNNPILFMRYFFPTIAQQ